MTATTSNETAHPTVRKVRRTRNWRRWSANFSVLGVSVATFVPGLCSGEGFRNSPAGAFNLGRAGGRITQVDDSSAVNENPANLMDIKQSEGQYTPSIIYFHVDYTSPGGEKEETKKPWKPLLNMFASTPIDNDKWAAGVGITVPYGLANEWKTDGAFGDPAGLRYTAPYFSQLITINVNPSVAARVHPRLTIGAGLDVMWTELSFRQYYPWAAFFGPGLPEGTAKLRGSGIGVGANIGITWELIDHHRLAVTYRAPMDASLDGHMNIDNVPAAATAAGASGRSEFNTKIKFPSSVNVGYGIELTEKIRAEISGEWVQFSRFDALNLDAHNNNVLLGGAPLTVREDWRDTFTVGIGGDWKFSPDWVARAGFRYYQTPVPDHTFSPSIPDANQKVFTFGLGYTHGHHTLEGAYGLDFYDQRVITSNTANPSYNGTYDLTVHLFSLSYKYAF